MTLPARVLIIDDDPTRGAHLAALVEQRAHSAIGPVSTDCHWESTVDDDVQIALVSVGDETSKLGSVLTTINLALHDTIPVLAVVPNSSASLVETCLAAGAADCMAGPLDAAMVGWRIDSCLEKHALAKELEGSRAVASQQSKLVDDLTNVILPIGAALSGEQNPDRLLERIVLEAMKVCNADAGTLYLLDEKTLRFTIMHTNSLGIALGGTTGNAITQPGIAMYGEDGVPNEHNVATYVAVHACSVNIPDVYEAEGFDFSGTRKFDARNVYRSKSCLAVALIDNASEVIGVLQLINALDPKTAEIAAFDSYAQQVVESLASLAAVAISNRRLIEQQEKLLKYERDVQIGRQIQSDFLPHQLPHLTNWEIATRFRPAREVSGDFYDIFELPGGRHVGLVIADISDKGVPAALFMALIRSLLRAFTEIPVPPSLLGLAERYAVSSIVTSDVKLATVLTHLNAVNAVLLTNNYVVRNHSEVNMFATLFCGVLDTETGLLTYVNCGHEPLVIIDDKGIQAQLGPTGPAVGLFEDMELDIERSILEPGDLLFGYTDGVTDARSPSSEFFSTKRLHELLEHCCEPQPQLTAEEVVGRVEEALISHIGLADQFDDITILAIRREASELATPVGEGS